MELIALSNFSLGQIYASSKALDAMKESGDPPADFLCKHAAGYWGNVPDDQADRNDECVDDGGRLVSSYKTARGEALQVVTDEIDESGNRPATTIMLISEYLTKCRSEAR